MSILAESSDSDEDWNPDLEDDFDNSITYTRFGPISTRLMEQIQDSSL